MLVNIVQKIGASKLKQKGEKNFLALGCFAIRFVV